MKTKHSLFLFFLSFFLFFFDAREELTEFQEIWFLR